MDEVAFDFLWRAEARLRRALGFKVQSAYHCSTSVENAIGAFPGCPCIDACHAAALVNHDDASRPVLDINGKPWVD